MTHYRTNVDRNQRAIMDALRAIGATVLHLPATAAGLPDLLVGFRGRTLLLEVKNPATRYGRAGMAASQRQFAQTWNGAPVYVVTTPSEAMQAIGVEVAS